MVAPLLTTAPPNMAAPLLATAPPNMVAPLLATALPNMAALLLTPLVADPLVFPTVPAVAPGMGKVMFLVIEEVVALIMEEVMALVMEEQGMMNRLDQPAMVALIMEGMGMEVLIITVVLLDMKVGVSLIIQEGGMRMITPSPPPLLQKILLFQTMLISS